MKIKTHFLNSFHLKLIGMITMVFDHIVVVFEVTNKFHLVPFFSAELNTWFRIIGRIAFVIFSFLTVEGIIKSKHKISYILRLFILAIILDLFMYFFMGEYIGNPIMSLAIGALTIYFLNDKKIYKKFFALLPIGYVLLVCLELVPMKIDYDIYGLSVFLVFYISYLISNLFSKFIINAYKLDNETFENSSYKLTLRNAISAILFISFSMIIYFINPIWNNKGLFTEMNSLQIYAILGVLPILFYNGQRGYDKKWFKYGCYIFFPLHIVIIYLITLFVV